MTDADLDQSYSAVCEAMSQVGEAQAPLFLSMLCLSLMSRFEHAQQVLPLIANARDRCDQEAARGR
ncbi:hypothetical protein [Hydrogenophaga sp.]|uniref:hypothetical protein n=1 Tax=Hydrogenophaga sp. TaxID=1904254 RepID=UPI003D12F26E